MRDEFLITRSGKQYVLFAGLLDEAHNRGLRGIDTELIQVPDASNGNVAIVKATAEMEGSEAGEAGGEPRRFSGIGDASPENVGRNIVPHIIRMAETRAKARALRDAVNVGATALEELSEGDDAPPAECYSQPSAGGARGASSRPTPIRGGGGSQGRGQRPRAAETNDGADGEADETGEANGRSEGAAASAKGADGAKSGSKGRGGQKARKSQVDLLKTLAVEWRGESGVERLENRVGKPLADLSRAEADEWIDRLTPEGRE